MPRRKTAVHARKGQPTAHPTEWAGLELTREDDELVYPIKPQVCSAPPPALCSFCDSFGKRTMCFEVFVAALYSFAFVDSGATHSFVSSEYCSRNRLNFMRLHSSAALADGSSVKIVDILRSLPLKIGAFRCKQTFLVLDMPEYDVVLGMDFLYAQDPAINYRKRTMQLRCANGNLVTTSAYQEEPELPEIDSEHIAVCTMTAFSRLVRTSNDLVFKNAVLAAYRQMTHCFLMQAPLTKQSRLSYANSAMY